MCCLPGGLYIDHLKQNDALIIFVTKLFRRVLDAQAYQHLETRTYGLNSFVIHTMSTGPPSQEQQNFVWTSKLFRFYLELYKNKFKNLFRARILKFLFRGLF